MPVFSVPSVTTYYFMDSTRLHIIRLYSISLFERNHRTATPVVETSRYVRLAMLERKKRFLVPWHCCSCCKTAAPWSATEIDAPKWLLFPCRKIMCWREKNLRVLPPRPVSPHVRVRSARICNFGFFFSLVMLCRARRYRRGVPRGNGYVTRAVFAPAECKDLARNT